jgi:hypothetical protein
VRDSNTEEEIRRAMIQSSRKSRDVLDDICNNHWCGRDGLIPWPANSTELTPPDFCCCVWGYIKLLVYGQGPQNETDLQQKAHITPEMLRATFSNVSVSARYELCRVRRCGHVEC